MNFWIMTMINPRTFDYIMGDICLRLIPCRCGMHLNCHLKEIGLPRFYNKEFWLGLLPASITHGLKYSGRPTLPADKTSIYVTTAHVLYKYIHKHFAK